MKFIYNSREKEHKNPFGAVREGTKVHFFVESDVDKVFLHGFSDTLEMQKTDKGFEIDVIPKLDCGLIFYTFEAIADEITYLYGKAKDGSHAVPNGEPYQLTVHKNADTPDWFKGKVMYQIYVDRFFKGDTKDTRLRDGILMHSSWNDKPVYVKNDLGAIEVWDFFGGNIDGVIQKLDYISGLGVDVIYLNPVFESPSNHKYDTSDYSKIDRMYGNEETMARLVAEAGKRGIKIMLDGVFSHTGDDSLYFNKYKTYGEGGAYNDKNSPYFSWYRFEEYPDKYDCWWGVTDLPAVDELAPSYQDYLLNEQNGAVVKWMRAGIMGWRLDVADELPDEFIKKLKDAVKKANPEAVLLGEVWEDASNKISYGVQRKYILEDSMQSVSDYPMRDALISMLIGQSRAMDFAQTIAHIQENYPKDVFLSLMNMTGTHDTVRLLTLLGEAPEASGITTWQQRNYVLPEDKMRIAQSRLMLYFSAIFTLPGNPCIYYGDEIGLQGYADPYNRGTFDWDLQNSRTVDFVRKLSEIRKQIIDGDVFLRFNEESSVLEYSLETKTDTHKVYMNHKNETAEVECAKEKALLLHNAEILGDQLKLLPYSVAVF